MNSTVKQCMNTFVHDTMTASQFRDILQFLNEHPDLQLSYVTDLSRKLANENEIKSPLADQLSLHLC